MTKEFDKATVKSHPEEREVGDFDGLVGQYYMDEGLLYMTARVVVRRGLIVGFRSQLLLGRCRWMTRLPFILLIFNQ